MKFESKLRCRLLLLLLLLMHSACLSGCIDKVLSLSQLQCWKFKIQFWSFEICELKINISEGAEHFRLNVRPLYFSQFKWKQKSFHLKSGKGKKKKFRSEFVLMIYNHNLSDRFEIIQIRQIYSLYLFASFNKYRIAFLRKSREKMLKTFLHSQLLWSSKIFAFFPSWRREKMPKSKNQRAQQYDWFLAHYQGNVIPYHFSHSSTWAPSAHPAWNGYLMSHLHLLCWLNCTILFWETLFHSLLITFASIHFMQGR